MKRLFLAAALLSCRLAGPVSAAEASSDLERRVEQRALETALAQVAEPDRLEVHSVRFVGADPVAETDFQLELQDVDGPNASGIVRVSLRMVAGERRLGEARATVRGTVRGPVLVAGRTLTGRQPINPLDVGLADADVTRLTGEPLRDPAQLAGFAPVRTLGLGRPISADLLQPVPLVRRGETVMLEARRGALVVRTKGRAKQDGAQGQTIPVENLVSGAELLGLVQSEGLLVVVRGPVEERER